MVNKYIFAAAVMMTASLAANAQNEETENLKPEDTKTEKTVSRANNALSRLSIGGYGEAVMSRNFYSQHFNRYRDPATYKDDKSHGRFDLPHVTLNLGYNFGKGWTMGMEIEFEHGGTESAVEIDADESGEYEAEVERGGEVALEQFWLNKAFTFQINSFPSIVLKVRPNSFLTHGIKWAFHFGENCRSGDMRPSLPQGLMRSASDMTVSRIMGQPVLMNTKSEMSMQVRPGLTTILSKA